MVISPSTISSVQKLLTTLTPGTEPTPTPHVLTESQTTSLNKLINHFSESNLKLPILISNHETKKSLTDWEKCSLLNREALIRCLKADKWDTEKCIKRIEDTIIWRRDCGADQILIDEEQAAIVKSEAETGKMFVLGYDKLARPIVHMRPRFQNTSVTPMRLQFTFWLIDRAIDLMPLGVDTVLLMIDLQGPQESPAYKQQREFVKILSAYYYERLGQALVLNMPTLFVWVLKLIRPVVDPVTYAKAVFDQPDPLNVAPADQLDDTLGGTNGYVFDIKTYWPALMNECQRRRNERLERWISTGKSIGSSEWIVEKDEKPEKASGSSTISPTPAVTNTNSSESLNPATTATTTTTTTTDSPAPVTLVVE
ncbi:hypothetical protein CROQUDRAFT_104312 [Cronartium quercuum f. sp. fusiforme G11]|uniref:CRAL-TRIO domain-containing protein n=1 Tax=Cronartium quercuum f. sp. fusiforme G11 TaxID=708437 RepID=A0A9P6NU87_9BASI|nr:hypothetical protein CROQUDRAFT_104312 [Cronartium quercuum f. sp. fusiforme G11]